MIANEGVVGTAAWAKIPLEIVRGVLPVVLYPGTETAGVVMIAALLQVGPFRPVE